MAAHPLQYVLAFSNDVTISVLDDLTVLKKTVFEDIADSY